MAAPSGSMVWEDPWNAAVASFHRSVRDGWLELPAPLPWQVDVDTTLSTWEVAPLDVDPLPYGLSEEPSVSLPCWEAAALWEAPSLEAAGGGTAPPLSSMAPAAVSKSKKRKLRRQLLHHEVQHVAALRHPGSGEAADVDASAHYLERVEAPRRTLSVQDIRGNVLRMALNKAGCRRLQDALEAATKPEQEGLVQELRGHVLECALHGLGCRFLEKCVEQLSPTALIFFGDELLGHVAELSFDPNGSRVLQRLLQFWPLQQLRPLVAELATATDVLARSKYGNLVVQDVLQMHLEPHCTFMLDVIRKNILDLAWHKFGSRVVERCIDREPFETARHVGVAAGGRGAGGSAAQIQGRDAVLEDLLRRAGLGQPSLLLQLAGDPIGNFVVQTVLKVARGALRAEALRQLSELRARCSCELSPHVIAALDRALEADQVATGEA